MGKDDHEERLGPRKSVLWRDNAYRDRCSPGRMKLWEAHHILCNHAMEGYEEAIKDMSKSDQKYIKDCLWITDWDLNNKGNMVALPENQEYEDRKGRYPNNKCSHQVDHNTQGGYTEEVKMVIRGNVFETLAADREKHELSAEDIAQLLKDVTSHFKDELRRRGRRNGGTKICWKNRWKKDDSYKFKWYYPFSMADDEMVRMRGRGVDKSSLDEIFKLLN
jgi:hypothetical protein